MESTYSESLAAFVERIYCEDLSAAAQGNQDFTCLVD